MLCLRVKSQTHFWHVTECYNLFYSFRPIFKIWLYFFCCKYETNYCVGFLFITFKIIPAKLVSSLLILLVLFKLYLINIIRENIDLHKLHLMHVHFQTFLDHSPNKYFLTFLTYNARLEVNYFVVVLVQINMKSMYLQTVWTSLIMNKIYW